MRRPYVLLNAATSADGKLAPSSRRPVELSNRLDKDVVEILRKQSDAILVGATTIRTDDPRLRLRKPESHQERLRWGLPAEPAKVTISTDCRLDRESRFFQTGDGTKFVFSTSQASQQDIRQLRSIARVF